MALNKNHQEHIDRTAAFDMADRNVKMDPKTQRANYGMGAKGLPRTPAQMASVKKAATASAVARKTAAAAPAIAAPVAARVPNAKAPAAHTPGVTTGGLSLVSRPKGGLLR